ncbi:MAG: aminoacyl-tRNA hydrolase [Deltaproteobacteria bacterium RIFCSPLOWO2_02_FULL_44_10]|nr:MAG: aminoacyl-tRNA hydrolase [Deltaproteobacteria bacterium RIFCSPHIGHO2_02_FULL_44_16]OGQ47091.1 MAG: aminoacyl-tRNA hydrolase [Deltaproteobacteria bacterium RIFCSPLOWO2_02_FULL_44_10]
MKLFVGLGNPGKKYALQRHNVGFWILDQFAADHGMTFQKKDFKGRVAKEKIGKDEVLLLKPETFMNLSGASVREAASFYRVALQDIVVVHDDLDIERGVIRFATNRGPAGNNGVASIIETLGTKEFCRLRFGIGRPGKEWDPADYVLSPFLPEEQPEIEAGVKKASKALAMFLEKGLSFVQQEYH